MNTSRKDDFSFIIEDYVTQQREGILSIYHVDYSMGVAEFGRWILRRGSLAATESALLGYRVTFDRFALGRVYCQTLSSNEQVVSFHRSCGLRESAQLMVCPRGAIEPVIEQSLFRENWPQVARRLDSISLARRGGIADRQEA